MPVVDALAVAVLVGCLLLIALVVRRRMLARDAGSLDLTLRLRPGAHGWAVGVGRIEGDRLVWFRVFSLSPRPHRVVTRKGLAVRARRRPEGHERAALAADAIVLECVAGDDRVDLALHESAVPGFLAWVESAPPGAEIPTMRSATSRSRGAATARRRAPGSRTSRG